MPEIKIGKGDVADLQATIENEQDSAIQDLAGQIATDKADIKSATEIRTQEASIFSAEEKDLVETINTLERASGIIAKGMNGGAALAQINKATPLIEVQSHGAAAEHLRHGWPEFDSSGADAFRWQGFWYSTSSHVSEPKWRRRGHSEQAPRGCTDPAR